MGQRGLEIENKRANKLKDLTQKRQRKEGQKMY